MKFIKRLEELRQELDEEEIWEHKCWNKSDMTGEVDTIIEVHATGSDTRMIANLCEWAINNDSGEIEAELIAIMFNQVLPRFLDAHKVMAQFGESINRAIEKKEISEMALLPLPPELTALADICKSLGFASDE